MRLTIEADLDYLLPKPADVLLQVEVAAMPDQRIEQASLTVGSDHPLGAVSGEDGIGQRCWVRGADRLVATYRATVTITREAIDLRTLPSTPARLLPAETVAYLLPSRYCQSDRLEGFVAREFAGLCGGALATALVDWTRGALDYRSGVSAGVTTALDTFASRSGVCRDYAHLLVALARAGEIPARCVAAYAPGVDPPDFHAVAELWLDGAWRLVDATGMARADEIARVCVGRDATDIAFMTVFGTATFERQRVSVRRDQERAARPIVFLSNDLQRGPAMNPIDDRALDSMSVAPDDDRATGGSRDPRQDAGQDKSISKRLQKNPDSVDARLDNGLDETMDASDPVSISEPSDIGEPAPSSGYDEKGEGSR